jgi:hypothetical protein
MCLRRWSAGLAEGRSATTEFKGVPQSNSRSLLRAFLREHFDREQAADPSIEGMELCSVLNEALEGLDDLDHGEALGIFAPTTTKYQRANPARTRRLQIRAVLRQKALERLGVSATKAQREIADRFGVSPVAIRKWREKYQKSQDYIDALRWAERYHGTCKKMGWPIPSTDEVLAAAKKDGEALLKLKMKPPTAPSKGK